MISQKGVKSGVPERVIISRSICGTLTVAPITIDSKQLETSHVSHSVIKPVNICDIEMSV